eukprot:scaffold5710_cov130-Isochrysis_galbana.AAC.2
MSGMLVYSQHHAHAWARCVTCRSARVTRNGYRVCSTSWRCDAPRTRVWLCGSPWCARGRVPGLGELGMNPERAHAAAHGHREPL